MSNLSSSALLFSPFTTTFSANDGIRILNSNSVSEFTVYLKLFLKGYSVSSFILKLSVLSSDGTGTAFIIVLPLCINADSANFGQPWLKFAVQQPKLGSKPNICDSLPFVLKTGFPGNISQAI